MQPLGGDTPSAHQPGLPHGCCLQTKKGQQGRETGLAPRPWAALPGWAVDLAMSTAKVCPRQTLILQVAVP